MGVPIKGWKILELDQTLLNYYKVTTIITQNKHTTQINNSILPGPCASYKISSLDDRPKVRLMQLNI